MEKENQVECIIRISDASPEILEPEPQSKLRRIWARPKGLFLRFVTRVWRFLKKAWDLGIDDPRKMFHCLKVGVTLTVVSFFYYINPLYDSFGGNALWALMTVVVVFEYTVGGTLYKSLNRICATSLAGFLALGVHWVARQAGHRFEPIIMGISLFIIASATTFSRFIPQVKARYDYGCTIFILTYGLVLLSGYRVEKLLDVAMERLVTVIIGTCLCIFISMLVCPIWAGTQLHLLVSSNMDKLASSLDSCVAEYFGEADEDSKQKLKDYKHVLSTKASEESMAEFARWEPAHGQFGFRHPWKNYIKLGSSSRSCAYCIEMLVSCLDSRNQVPETIRNHLRASCLSLSSASSNVIRELSTSVSSMTRSTQLYTDIKEMKKAVQQLQDNLQTLPNLSIQSLEEKCKKHEMPLTEIIQLVSFTSLLIEIASRIGGIVKKVEELADLAEYKLAEDEVELQNTTVLSKITYKDENSTTLQQTSKMSECSHSSYI
uniref:aluminum-activated malate transporter 10-like n=1 Tax=Erigeron canadensis TaxID=72917 RepID=UPI001CB986F7|nr:aluminum-activated malate transporter 10-like [Erigeron canadensis]